MSIYKNDEQQILQDILDEIILSIYIKQHILIDKQSSIVVDNTMKFFKIDLSAIRCGLTHQLGNYKTLIRYCYHNNLKLNC